MRTTGLKRCGCIAIALLLALALHATNATADESDENSDSPNPDRMTVHEWGTFTVLQDETGTQLAGVNVDDEPVPGFVHHIPASMILPTVLDNRYWFYRMKGVPRSHPHVTVRLETPVLYFYPPAGQSEPVEVDVRAEFKGGWLTEYYPDATFDIEGVQLEDFRFDHLDNETIGSLTWEGLKVGTNDAGPQTDEHVWLAPRQVRAVPVTATNGEAENYVFYRGVGQFNAPLRVLMDRSTGNTKFEAQMPGTLTSTESLIVPDLWIVHVAEDGKVAFRHLTQIPFDGHGAAGIESVSYRFEEEDFEARHLDSLIDQMHACLVEQGLFADEATAMLSTWQRAYFKSPGLRVFFPVSREWTDHRLALDLSVEADIERVMMCRIELISDRQRGMLSTLAMGPVSDAGWVSEIKDPETQERLIAGRVLEDSSGLDVPDDFKLYMQLGRFRNALLIAEEKRSVSDELTQFINNYRLQAFRPPTHDVSVQEE